MKRKEKDSIFLSKMEADYEKIAERKMVKLSDNSEILILSTIASRNSNDTFNLVVIPGWASIVLGWDDFLMKAKDLFNIYYLETREKKEDFIEKVVPKLGKRLIRSG